MPTRFRDVVRTWKQLPGPGARREHNRPTGHELLLIVDQALIESISLLAFREGDARVAAFATALENGELNFSSTAGALQTRLGVPNARLRPYRDVLLAAS